MGIVRLGGLLIWTLLFGGSAFFGETAFAQNQPKIDSLKRVLKTAGQDTNRVKALCELCTRMESIRPDSALIYGKMGLKLAEKLGAQKQIAYCLYTIGSLYNLTGDFPRALECLEKSGAFAQKNNDKIVEANVMAEIGKCYYLQGEYSLALKRVQNAKTIYDGLKIEDKRALVFTLTGVIYTQRGDFVLALKNFQQAQKLYEKLKDPTGLANVYEQLGIIYFYQQELDKALSFLQKSLDVYEPLNLSLPLAEIYNIIASAYATQKKFKEAKIYFEKSQKHYIICDNKYGIGQSYSNLGALFADLKEYNNALKNFQQAQKIYEEIGIKDDRANLLNEMSKIALKTNRPAEALAYNHQALTLAREVNAKKYIYDIYIHRSQIDSTQGDFRAALKHHKLAVLYKDSLFNIEKQKQFTEINTKFETEKKEQQILTLKIEKNLQEKNNALRERNYQIAGGAGCVILLLSIGFYVRQRRSNNILQGKNIEITQQKEEIEAQSEQINLQFKDLQAKNAEIIQQSEEIEAQSEQINEQFIQLQELSAFKDATSAMIVHDLKNPLSSIINLAEKEYSPRNQAMIRQAGKQMLNLTLNILDVQKFENTEINLNLSDVNMFECAQAAVEQVQLLLENKKQRLVYRIPAGLAGRIDNELIERVMVNLLTNAIKYTPNNGTITLQAEEIDDAFIKFSVSDTGQGIPADKIHLVFEKFGQIEAKSSGGARSTGLGLTYCKMVVEAHGGTIDFASEVGRGTTFFFPLPRGKDSALSPAENDKTQTAFVGLNYAPEVELALSEAALAYLAPFILKLQKFEVYEITDIQHILRDVLSVSEPVQKWKEKVENAVHFCNEEEYQKLLTEIK